MILRRIGKNPTSNTTPVVMAANLPENQFAMKKVKKDKSTLTPEERKKLIQDTINIGIQIMPKFKAAPNPHKK